jgi:hypothetical protein
MTPRLSAPVPDHKLLTRTNYCHNLVLFSRLVFTKCWIHKLRRQFFVDISFISGLLFSFIASDVKLTTS